jgi:hypothetical protein
VASYASCTGNIPATEGQKIPAICRKQSQMFFTNFIETSYAFFTNVVLKYILSARNIAARR